MNEMIINPENLKEKAKSLMHQKQKRRLRKILTDKVLYRSLPKKEIYDLIGELLLIDALFFMEDIYPKFHKNISNYYNYNEMFEMERYILENYIFFAGEKIITCFKGKTIQKDTQVVGRVYLTNYRIIAHGKFGPTPGSSFAATAIGSGSSTGSGASSTQGANVALYMGLNDYIQKKVQKQVQELMNINTPHNNPCFGYQYPIMGVYNIIRKKKKINYEVDIEYEKGNRIKIKRLKMRIVPKQGFSESTKNFNNRRNRNLDQIAENLK
ncbi:MAG: hypothetical protein ACFFC3_07815 [Candidatus Odinarchaeota archaeon]